jgi:hypothetical protein
LVKWTIAKICWCVCVCVCERERETETENVSSKLSGKQSRVKR